MRQFRQGVTWVCSVCTDKKEITIGEILIGKIKNIFNK